MKYILFTSKQPASNNIAKYLIETEFAEAGKNTWKKEDFILIDCLTSTVLDIVSPLDSEFALILSPHRSETKKPCLTTHTSGNWCNKADFGGEPNKLSFSNPFLMRSLLLKMFELNNERKLGFDVCYEADHHGPTLDIPYTFVEVGSSEEQWNNMKACEIVADSVLDSIKQEKKTEVFFGIGFSHYMPAMTKYVLNNPDSAGHLLPTYAIDCLDDKMFLQGIERNKSGKADYVLLEKKAFNSSQKKVVEELCKKHEIELRYI